MKVSTSTYTAESRQIFKETTHNKTFEINSDLPTKLKIKDVNNYVSNSRFMY